MEKEKIENIFSVPIGNIGRKYQILKIIAEGGEGIVCKIKDIENNIYAIKFQHRKDNNFNNEVKIFKLLKEKKCKAIPDFIASGECEINLRDEGFLLNQFLIQEYAPHRDLGDYILIDKTGFEEKHCQLLFYKIVKCLKSLHDCQICHRDLKLDNIILDEKYNPKICDFGFAIEYQSVLFGNLGTDCYKAPEVSSSEGYDGYKVDIFNLGMILIGLRTGKYKFDVPKEKNKFYGYIKDDDKTSFWKPFETICIGLSDTYKDLCFKMIAYEPDKRPSIVEILKHEWFGNIPNMNEEELKKYESDIKLKEELEKKEIKILSSISPDYVIENKVDQTKANTKGLGDDIEPIFKSVATPQYIEANILSNYCINIKGQLRNRVEFMTLVHESILKIFDNGDCWAEVEDKNKLKFDLIFEIKKGEEYEYNIMEIILCENETTEEYFLRFIRKKMSKNDFIEKFKKICSLLRVLN